MSSTGSSLKKLATMGCPTGPDSVARANFFCRDRLRRVGEARHDRRRAAVSRLRLARIFRR